MEERERCAPSFTDVSGFLKIPGQEGMMGVGEDNRHGTTSVLSSALQGLGGEQGARSQELSCREANTFVFLAMATKQL